MKNTRLLKNTRFLTLLAGCLLLVLHGCSSTQFLVSKAAIAPASIDLSGDWLVRKVPGGDRRGGAAGPREPPLVISRSSRQQRSQRQRSSSGVSAHVFLESGEALKITQTQHGLFISYDRSVVEEYTFGENRVTNIGPIEALRVSGWDGDSFVVETLDDTGTTLFETWHLAEERSLLIRDIRISKDEKDSFVSQQVFDRQ